MKILGKRKKVQGTRSSGFTLIELLVTIGIFVFMTALVLAKYNTFSSGTLLSNLVYDVALSVRQAQTYGVSVKAVQVSDYTGSPAFDAAYGVHFVKDTSSYVFFEDRNNNKQYDGLGEMVSTYTLRQGAKISSLCTGNDLNTCHNQTTKPTIVDITFKRPDPNAIIFDPSSLTVSPFTEITLVSGDGKGTRTVTVSSVGQVSVGN